MSKSGRDRAKLLEACEASFDHVAFAVGLLVEGAGPAAEVPSAAGGWSRCSGIVTAMPRCRSRRPGPQPPEHPVDHLSVIKPRTTTPRTTTPIHPRQHSLPRR
ncbi:hypothetical protein SGR_136 [Streptomyces griseus subsp. griseus NBRC 13350]|uniref:Uncharacterized protein n=1 Tax=Streptomyces griseus subsp. griseus (strain JCM 4626 / CBS 651.72 / NBRC 13350 / KCC S-0626 / ISP 5235) TaxID=455632 RepID=B1VNE2_STRGG|nr:hypothetical protein SGR_136 [Streptomyces griseus subsp. griseus NBRC 13350]